MSLSSLISVDQMIRQPGDMGRYVAANDPLAGGSQLGAGNKLPELNDPFSNITAPGQIPDRYKKGFEEFYRQNPDDYMRMGGQAISYVTTPQGETIQFGDTGGATNFRRYLESIGETPRDDSLSLAQGSGPLATMEGQTPPGFGPQVIDQKLIDQTEFNQFPGNPNRKPADPANLGSAKVGIFPFPGMDSTETATATVPGIGQDITGNNPAIVPIPSTPNPIQTGGLGDQGLMDRLTSLEQGIGSLQNQIANLFQMGQASDPFGLGGFINTRRY